VRGRASRVERAPGRAPGSVEVCFVEKQEKCEKTGKNQFHRYLLNGVDL